MRGRIVQTLIVIAAFGIIIAVALGQHPRGSASTYSTYDTGMNGYRVLYDVLARENIPVMRLESRAVFLPPEAGAVVITDTEPERLAGMPYVSLDASDVRQLKKFAKHGRVILFTSAQSPLAFAFGKAAIRLDPAPYTNEGLEKDPQSAARVYRLVVSHGTVAFDERVHGFVQDRSFWEALPPAVHVAVWIVLAILALLLIDQNIRVLPTLQLEEPADRDSSSYIRSMAAMLRRGRAGPAVVSHFSEDAARMASRNVPAETTLKALHELQTLTRERANDSTVLRAAQLYAVIRKGL